MVKTARGVPVRLTGSLLDQPTLSRIMQAESSKNVGKEVQTPEYRQYALGQRSAGFPCRIVEDEVQQAKTDDLPRQ